MAMHRQEVTQQKYLSLQHMYDTENGNSASFVVVLIQHLGLHVGRKQLARII